MVEITQMTLPVLISVSRDIAGELRQIASAIAGELGGLGIREEIYGTDSH
jgi:ketol-acid reductoisomerase